MSKPPVRKSERVAGVLRDAARLDREWIGKVPADDPACTPWMPFPMDAFIAMTAEAMPEIEGDRFLDIGCGPGSKMLVAQELFGLEATGFDRVPAYVTVAAGLGLNVTESDAVIWNTYDQADLIWFNRVFKDEEQQSALEQKVFDQAGPGAVVMCANLGSKPPPGWFMILEDAEVRRGIWQKPNPAWR